MSVDLGLLPFYWQVFDEPPTDRAVPTHLPFSFAWRSDLGLVVQRRHPAVLDALRAVYDLDANVGYLQEGHALAALYSGDFLRFINQIDTPGPAALEIGCGGCYLLNRLKARGFAPQGVDPSPVAARAGAHFDIPVAPALYAANLDLGRHDLVLHYDVLEHIDDPVGFLRAHLGHLTAGGRVVVAVPDCTRNIAAGDPSMAIHEHLNYFTADSLSATFVAAGYRVLQVQASEHGGVLYCAATPGEGIAPSVDPTTFHRFTARLETSLDRVRTWLRAACARGEVGIYVPLRALPYLGDPLIPATQLRFFNDDPGLHGRYLPGCPRPVEGLDDLRRDPPPSVFVASFSFATEISTKVRDAAPEVRVQTLPGLTAIPS